jgi:tetratricopeptide (TPR) repeat protein
MHAHEHGILHGDLKPANILLTDEGQPMLLDFNLATDIKVRATLGELRVGGTLPYMAPEHLSALLGGDKRNVDARSDIYALGVILFEMLTGKLPFQTKRGPLAETLPVMIGDRKRPAPGLRQHNSAISPAVESIVRHRLEPDPQKRYHSAQALHEDLQRHAHDLPLRHAPEPSLRERAGKWMRRHPYLTAPANVIAVCFILLGTMMAPGAWQAWQDWQADRMQLAHAKSAVDQAKKWTEDAHKKLVSADERARGAEARVQALDHSRAFHASALVARELIDRVTLTRMRPETWPSESNNITKLSVACREVLGKYHVFDEEDWQSNANVAALPDAERDVLRADVASLLYALVETEILGTNRLRINFDSNAIADHVGFAASLVHAMAHARVATAMNWNARARQCFPADELPRALLIQQANLTSLSGDAIEAGNLAARAESLPLREAVDDAYWTAARLAAQAKLKDADALLAEVTRQIPDHFSAWRLRALCYQSAGEFRKAESCWDTYAALKPDDEWARYYRGQSVLHLRKWSDAQKDFDAFLKRHPSFRAAYLERSAAWEGQQNYRAAINDLTKALELGPESLELLFHRLELMEKSDDKQGAERDRIRLLSTEPENLDGWVYRGMLKAKNDPKAALIELERALAVDPNYVPALYQKAILLADRLERPVEAVGALNRLLIADPKHADALLKRGFLYAKAGLRDVALANVERALKYDLTPARCYQAACIFAFTSQEAPGDRERVIKMLESALRNGYGNDRAKNDPNLPLAHIPEAVELLRAAPFLGPMPIQVKD